MCILIFVLAVFTVVGSINIYPGTGTGNYSCPAWIDTYASFHVREKTNPNAKYLIGLGNSNGMGDRIRGMMYAVKVAVATNRVVLFSWGYEHGGAPIDYYFRPTKIDRRASTSLFNYSLTMPQTRLKVDHGAIGKAFFAAESATIDVPDRIYALELTEPLKRPCYGCPNITSLDDEKCLWEALFAFHEEDIKLARLQLRSLLQLPRNATIGSDYMPFVAIHLRMGGQLGEAEAVRVGGGRSLDALLGALSCAQKFRRRMKSTLPVLLITDNSALRTFMQKEGASLFKNGLVSPRSNAAHIANLRNVTRDATRDVHKALVLDLIFLSIAQCFVYTGLSLFSRMAVFSRPDISCSISVQNCTAVPH